MQKTTRFAAIAAAIIALVALGASPASASTGDAYSWTTIKTSAKRFNVGACTYRYNGGRAFTWRGNARHATAPGPYYYQIQTRMTLDGWETVGGRSHWYKVPKGRAVWVNPSSTALRGTESRSWAIRTRVRRAGQAAGAWTSPRYWASLRTC